MAVAVVDLFLARQRIRAELTIGGFTRVSDLINSGAGKFLSGNSLRIEEVPSHGLARTDSVPTEFALPLSAVHLIVPINEPSPGPAPSSLHRERERIRAAIDCDEWRVVGELHLIDRVRWVDFLASSQGKFVPVTGATVTYSESPSPITADFVLVNGARITALFPST